ncbi:MAG: hypothetical protein AAFP89_06320 [Bacteroidota bacterium]
MTYHIEINVPVKGNYQSVLAKFERELFEKLSPPGASVDLVRFDGSHKGDIVHIRLKLFGLIQQDWISEITEEGDDGQMAFFVDQGTQLPFFLSYWHHKHIVRKLSNDSSEIIDDIHFRTPWWLPGWLMYPVLWAQFAYRKPIYQKYFGKVGE